MSTGVEKIRISCVSYLNSKPFLFGLQHHSIHEEIEVSLDHPRDCAEKLIQGKVEIGLVPVASIPLLKNHTIITNKCIAADGDVLSVMLFSECPIDDIETILLDYQSLTSVNLCKLLCRDFWNIHPDFIQTEPGYENEIKGTTAAVVIGDRALQLLGKHKFAYDLPGAWKKMTGLPFVFACWVTNSKLPEGFESRFDEALEAGLDAIEQLIPSLAHSHGIQPSVITDYFKKHLKFRMTERHREAMKLYLGKIII